MNYICFNGQVIDADEPVLMADNRGYRYGDGLFETMKVIKQNILLPDYHFQRFFDGLQMLKMNVPTGLTKKVLAEQILSLCEKNNCARAARVRLSAFSGNGGLSQSGNALQYIIECRPLDEQVNQLNEAGLVVGLYTDSQKSCDTFSNLKSANFLPYVMAAKCAQEKAWDECLVLNVYERIADATIANVFLIMNGEIITPPLNEGCVNGVMRRYLIEELDAAGYSVREQPVTPVDVEKADEFFLTNAISGIRWVRQFRKKQYDHSLTSKIYHDHIEPLWK